MTNDNAPGRAPSRATLQAIIDQGTRTAEAFNTMVSDTTKALNVLASSTQATSESLNLLYQALNLLYQAINRHEAEQATQAPIYEDEGSGP